MSPRSQSLVISATYVKPQAQNASPRVNAPTSIAPQGAAPNSSLLRGGPPHARWKTHSTVISAQVSSITLSCAQSCPLPAIALVQLVKHIRDGQVPHREPHKPPMTQNHVTVAAHCQSPQVESHNTGIDLKETAARIRHML